jgi:hypothetical protein
MHLSFIDQKTFDESLWTDKIIECEEIKEHPNMKIYNKRAIYYIGRIINDYNPSYSDYQRLQKLFQFTEQKISPENVPQLLATLFQVDKIEVCVYYKRQFYQNTILDYSKEDMESMSLQELKSQYEKEFNQKL